jgi:hypothetical protein
MFLQVENVEHSNAIISTPPKLNSHPLSTGLNKIWNLRKARLICFKIGYVYAQKP